MYCKAKFYNQLVYVELTVAQCYDLDAEVQITFDSSVSGVVINYVKVGQLECIQEEK